MRSPTRRRNEAGQAVLLLIAALGVFLIGALGLAVDGAQMFAQQQMAQTAADAAAQAGILSLFRGTNAKASAPWGAGSPPSSFTCATTDARTPCVYARLNGFGGTASDTVSVTFPAAVAGVSNLSSVRAVNVIAVTVQRTLRTALIRMVGPATVTVQATATAATVTTGLACLTALSPSGDGATTIANNANVQLINCGIWDNSGSPSALVVNNNGVVQAGSIDVVGGAKIGNNASVEPPPTTGAAPLSDPLASVPALAYSASPCYTNTVISNNQTKTLQPGVHCGGISISNNASVTFNAGQYVLLGGGLNTWNNVTLTGQNVTSYNTFDSTHPFGVISLRNNVIANLSAPANGARAGMLFFEDRNAPTGNTEVFDNNANQSFTEALYFPRNQVSLMNNGSAGSRNIAIVADTILLNNNATLTIDADPNQSGAPRGQAVALVK